MTLPSDDEIRVQLIVDAQGSIRTLKEVNQEGEKIRNTFDKVENSANKATNSVDKGFKNAEKSAKGFNQVLNLIRGTIVAIGVFRVFQFVEESLQKATQVAQDFETSLYRIANVERILSQAGIETSVAGLRDVIRDVKEELPIFSEADITQQVSLIGIMTKEFGLTEMQIGEVAKAIGVLNIRSGETEDLLTTTNKVLTALVAPSGKGIASLGLDFSQAAIEAKAFETGVLKSGEAFTALTDHEKDMIKIALLLESTGQELETVQKFLETNTGALAEQNAEWEDTLRILGQAVIGVKASFAPFAVDFLKWLQDALNGVKAMQIIFQALRNEFSAFAQVVALFLQNPLDFIKNYDAITAGLADVFTSSLEDGFNSFFSGQIPQDAPQWFVELFGQFAKEEDTATEATKNLANAIQSITELEGFDKLIDDVTKLQQKLQDTQEEFDIDQSRAFEDYQIKIARIQEDYAIKRSRIIADTNDKLADANKKYRDKERNDEAKFQEDMRQLREKYLFNLEDALRERDARQVLRLQRQYEMDKTALTNEYELRQQQNAQQHQDDLARIQQEGRDRLAELAQEEAIRLQREAEDFALRQERAKQDHEREMEQLRQQLNDRLMAFAEALGQEYNLNEEGVNALYNLLQSYYGPGGKFDDLYNYSTQSIINNAQGIVDLMNQLVQQMASIPLPSLNPSLAGASANRRFSEPYYLGNQAQGGSYLATSPTTATFGEAGPELATFIPLKNTMPATNLQGAGGAGGLGGLGGMLKLMIDLNPDLKAQIVNESLNEVSTVIRQTERERG